MIALSAAPVVEAAAEGRQSCSWASAAISPQETSRRALVGTPGVLLHIHEHVVAPTTQSRIAFGVTPDDSD